MMIKKQIIYFILFLFLTADLSYSFVQHISKSLDGDMAGGLIPAKNKQTIFHDPIGISHLTKDFAFPNPNRFFAHRIFYDYFKNVPIFLQSFTNPIDSVYLSCAIAKIIIQFLLIFVISCYITASRKFFSTKFIITFTLITPLFQTNGYQTYMGIIDPSITYTFFYALPCALLLVFYLPFFNNSFYKINFPKNISVLFLLIILCIIISFNGPILTGVILIINFLYLCNKLINNFQQNKQLKIKHKILASIFNIPRSHFVYFTTISTLSIYSLYLGANDPTFPSEIIPVSERYFRLLSGLYYLLTQKIGLPLLILIILINLFFIKRNLKSSENNKFLTFISWIGIFAFLYIILLPLGGYRNYRPNILRYDTFMPITIALIFIYGKSSFELISHLKNNMKKVYIIFIIVISAIFTIADKPDFYRNECEKNNLKKIAQSPDNVVIIKNDCNILSWRKITDPKDSEINGELLKLWRITKDKKLYYQK